MRCPSGLAGAGTAGANPASAALPTMVIMALNHRISFFSITPWLTGRTSSTNRCSAAR